MDLLMPSGEESTFKCIGARSNDPTVSFLGRPWRVGTPRRLNRSMTSDAAPGDEDPTRAPASQSMLDGGNFLRRNDVTLRLL